MKRRRHFFSLCGALAVAGPAAAQTITPSPIDDHFAIRASYFRGSASTEARVDDTTAGPGGIGTPFSAEDDFRLPDGVRKGRVEFMIRLRERGKLRVDLFDLPRKGSTVMRRTIEYGDQTYAVNERVNSELNWRAINFTWTYSFIHNDRFELGPGLGLHLIQAETSAAVPTRSARESFDGSGPFVTVAVDAVWRMTQRFALSARAQSLRLTVSDITGSLSDYHADLQFRWRPNLAFGVGWQSNRMQLEALQENPGGTMDFNVSGPELFLRASF